jgi:hypothetical protein
MQYSCYINMSSTSAKLQNVINGIKAGDIMGLRAWYTGGYDWQVSYPRSEALGSPTSAFAEPGYFSEHLKQFSGRWDRGERVG